MKKTETLEAARSALDDAQVALRNGMVESARKLLLAVSDYLDALAAKAAK